MVLTKNTSRALQRQIDLITAVCQERILATHVRHVLGLVDLISDRVPFDDALDIYVRILRLTPEQARNVGSRALAELGRRTELPESFAAEGFAFDPDAADEDSEVTGDPTGGSRSDAILSRLRKRIRGRVRDDLRSLIDLATARTEDAILETHAENALTFAKTLDDELSAPDAIDLYLETMALPESIGDVIYNRALHTIADSVLPSLPPRPEAAVSATADGSGESMASDARR